MKDETLQTAFQNWEVLSDTQEEVVAYETRLKRVLDEEAAVREAELREQEARQEGQEEGLHKGIEAGRKEEKQKITHQLLRKGMKIKDIVDITGLSEEQVLEIQEDMKN